MSSRSFDQPYENANCVSTRTVDAGCGSSSSWQESRPVGHQRGAYSAGQTQAFYRKKRNREFIPPQYYERWDFRAQRHPYAVTTAKRLWCNGTWHTQTVRNGTGCAPWNYDTASGSLNVPWKDIDRNALLVAAMADCAPALDALTSLAEAHKTLDMILGLRKRAVKLARELLRGGTSSLRSVSSMWLEWRYGWRLLLKDMEAAETAILHPDRGLIISGKSKDALDISRPTWETESTWGWDSSTIVFKNRFEESNKIQFRGRVFIKTRMSTLNAQFDPWVTAWELVPYSFVADWFVNVGDILKAWRVQRLIERAYFTISERQDASLACQQTVVNMMGPEGPYTFGGTGASREIFTKRCRTQASMPILIPTLTVHLTSPRIADAAALMATSIFRRR